MWGCVAVDVWVWGCPNANLFVPLLLLLQALFWLCLKALTDEGRLEDTEPVTVQTPQSPVNHSARNQQGADA